MSITQEHESHDKSGVSADRVSSSGSEEDKSDSFFQQVRDICESLIIALFLAFLFKTFEAEAFVIPTGSMAPTLKGRHKDVACPECGFQYQISASEEIDAASNRRTGRHVVGGTCPQCFFTQCFGDEVPSEKQDKLAPSFTGDRILVSKMEFDWRDLRRFDVSVFRCPAEPRVNYIKRFVGLPNEKMRIQYGDVFVQSVDPVENALPERLDHNDSSDSVKLLPDGSLDDSQSSLVGSNVGGNADPQFDKFNIVRKDYKYLRQIMQIVYDSDYAPSGLDSLGWPSRWYDPNEQNGSKTSAWVISESKSGRTFSIGGASHRENIVDAKKLAKLAAIPDTSSVTPDDEELSWLRYRHIVPSSNDWFWLKQRKLPSDVTSSGVVANNPQLISDFTSYNAGFSRLAHHRYANDYEWTRDSQDEFSVLSSRYEQTSSEEPTFWAKNPDGFGCNWVGDLGFACDLTIEETKSDSDCLVFDLVKGGVVFRCVVAPSRNKIAIDIPQVPEFATATTDFVFKRNKKYRFEFFNVDEEMRVVVNGKELAFSGTGRYDLLAVPLEGKKTLLSRDRDPTARDLSPVGIGAKGLVARLDHAKILRDVYYIAAGRALESWDDSRYTDFGTARCDRLTTERVYLGDESSLANFMSSPEKWSGYGSTKSALFCQGEGQYIALGDNSGFSLDSRLWATNTVPHYVDRKNLIGKAFYVYWPHGKLLPFWREPFWPNFKDMRHID